MSSFDSCVGCTSVSDAVKLNRLFEDCTGNAAKVIKSCALMHPSKGHQQARRLLYERFGNDYRISQTWISKVTEGSVHRPHNGEDVQDFTDDVRGCIETPKARDKLHEIYSHTRMVKIIERLTMHLQSRWCKEAVSIKETKGKYPDKLVKATEPESQKLNPSQNIVTHACENHQLDACSRLKKMTTEKRLEFKDNRMCFSCLKVGKHTVKWCWERIFCGIDGCTSKHSRLLYQKTPTSLETDINTEPQESVMKETVSSCAYGS